jgi:hypothetical protein
VLAQSPSIDFGNERVGMAVLSALPPENQIPTLNFMSVAPDLSGEPSLIQIDIEPQAHHLQFAQDRFIVVWAELIGGEVIGEYIYGQTFDEYGNPLSEKTILAGNGAGHARDPSLLTLGDRSMLFWAEDITGNFELYMKTIDNGLRELDPTQQLTVSQDTSKSPGAAFGPDGQAAVLYEEGPGGAQQAYMLRLSCGPE